MTTYRVTAQDVCDCAREIIENHGWQRSAWPQHGPAPRCIRAALSDAWKHLSGNDPRAKGTALSVALRLVSQAIYGKAEAVGGIMEWEYRKATDQAAVVEVLRKAASLPTDLDAPTSTGGAV
jgi:hypothetical protein